MTLSFTPHLHPEDFNTGSSLSAFIAQAAKLGRKAIACTPRGHMSACLRAYHYAKEKGLKSSLGTELILVPSVHHFAGPKFYTITLLATSKAGYQALCSLSSSKGEARTILGGDEFPAHGWAALESISKQDVVAVVGGPNCLVGKAAAVGEGKAANAAMERLSGLFPGRLWASVVGADMASRCADVIRIEYEDGTLSALYGTDKVDTAVARRCSALELANDPDRHAKVRAEYHGPIVHVIDKNIKSATATKRMVPLPGGDAIATINRAVALLARRHGANIVYTDYAYLADPDDKAVQDLRLEGHSLPHGWHMQPDGEARERLWSTGLLGSLADVDSVFAMNDELMEVTTKYDLKYDFKLPTYAGDVLKDSMAIIRANSRMPWGNKEYEDRLRRELVTLAKGKLNLLPYFMPIRDVLNWHIEQGCLTGPGRGSAAGCLFMYLMAITEVDPIKHGLSMERFYSDDRAAAGDIPDVDVDLPNKDLLIGKDGKSGYLYGRWGSSAAQVSTRSMMRLKSAIKDVNRYLNNGNVDPEIEQFTKGLPNPPQGVSDSDWVFGYLDGDKNPVKGYFEQSEDLQRYAEVRPQEWELVKRCLGLPRQRSRHASAFIITDGPVGDIAPTFDGNITQYEAKEVEQAGLIKYDFLGVSQLQDIQLSIKLINERAVKDRMYLGYWHPESDSGTCGHCVSGSTNDDHSEEVLVVRAGNSIEKKYSDTMKCSGCGHYMGPIPKDVRYFFRNGRQEFVWALPEDQGVFSSVWDGNAETIFQIKTDTMRPHVMAIMPSSIDELAAVLALVRNGPLDFIDEATGRNMAEEYAERKHGRSEPMPVLMRLLPDTYGTLVYQEQLERICVELGGMDPITAGKLRKLISKKKAVEVAKFKPKFMAGAVEKLGEQDATTVWDMMETFGKYGFNKSHSVSYAYITYASMYLRHHYPLEWWSAILTNADEAEITGKLWKHVKGLIAQPDVNISGDTMTVDYAANKIRSKLGVVKGLGEKAVLNIAQNRPYVDAKDFLNRSGIGMAMARKMVHAGVCDSLFSKGTDLLDKMQTLEDASKQIEYDEKIAAGKKPRPCAKGKVPEEYVGVSRIQEAAMRKNVLPTLPMDLNGLISLYSPNFKIKYEDHTLVRDTEGENVVLVPGESLARLDELVFNSYKKIAIACYVAEAKEFSYGKKKDRRALKLLVDADGALTERVIWPDYDTGQLTRPPGLEKGKIVTLFMLARPGKKGLRIYGAKAEH